MPTVELDGQYRALREEAGMTQRDIRAIDVRGSDAAEYLQGQVTNDVEALEPGQGCYAALLDRKGRMQADMRILRLDDEIRVEVEPEALPAALRHLTMYSVGRDVEVADAGDATSVLAVSGPAAVELAGIAPLGAEHDHRPETIDGIPFRAVRTGTGFDALVAADQAQDLEAALADRGIAPVGEAALEVLRVERGVPRFGREMTTKTIPQEAGINERAVSFTKGCYIGQETVARLHYKGKPNRHLRGLLASEPLTPGATVLLGERELGQVGTAVISPARGPLALAILRREAEPGVEVAVESDGGITAAVVAELPFDG